MGIDYFAGLGAIYEWFFVVMKISDRLLLSI